MKPHKHAEVIKAWADGAQIQFNCYGEWKYCAAPLWEPYTEYRVKPAAPKWPETKMSGRDLHRVYANHNGNGYESMISAANAALRHACETGQVVTREAHEAVKKQLEAVSGSCFSLVGTNSKREMKIARAVRHHLRESMISVDLAAIIAEVKP